MRFVFAWVWALWLVGCCGAMPETRYYRLVSSADAVSPRPIAGVLSIEGLEADAVYADDRIVYRTSPYQLAYYNYHRWSAPPAIHLTYYLRDAYARTGLFRSVLTSLTGRTDATLSGHLTAFDEIDVSKSSWVGRIELELRLEEPDSGKILWERRFAETEAVQERTPEGLTAALSTAMQRIIVASAPAVAEAMQREKVTAEPSALR